MIEIETLWQWIDERVEVREAEEVPLLSAVGSCLAEGVLASHDLPAFDHSSMDGFAFAEACPGECRVVMEVAAGGGEMRSLSPGEAARVLTGGGIPPGTFGVVRQEDCTRAADRVQLRRSGPVAAGESIRRRGTIRRAGEVLLPAGTRLTPGGISFLVAGGAPTVRVPRPPRILHVSTGAELLAPGQEPAPGQIADSNGPMMQALLERAGHCLERLLLADEAPVLQQTIQEFDGDLLLISGGSGPGDHDHTCGALAAAGYSIHANRLNSRPGKPLLFATRGRQVAFGLPGNPLSHWVCHQAFVRRALYRMLGAPPPELVSVFCPPWPAVGGDGRRTWTPAVQRLMQGRLEVEPLPWQHSGDLSPLAQADALLLDEPDPQTQLVAAYLL
jgi:molybdopterin molybdotransferase